jgi:hypothetical protein
MDNKPENDNEGDDCDEDVKEKADDEEFCVCDEEKQEYFYKVYKCKNCNFTSSDPDVILCPNCKKSPCFAVDVCSVCGNPDNGNCEAV